MISFFLFSVEGGETRERRGGGGGERTYYSGETEFRRRNKTSQQLKFPDFPATPIPSWIWTMEIVFQFQFQVPVEGLV